MFGLAAAAIVVPPSVELIAAWPTLGTSIGQDFRLNLDAARGWLDGEPFYPAAQLAGPFEDDGLRILYPPTALWLFAPLAMVARELAAIVWLGFPAAALALQAIRFRPAPWVWPLLAICLAWPPTALTVIVGNPALLCVGLLALGTMYRWPSAFIAIKAGVLPFALWGVRHRSWWAALAVVAAAGVPFGLLWVDWVQTIANSRVGGIWHSIQQVPIFLIPVLIWLGRTRGEGTIGRSTA